MSLVNEADEKHLFDAEVRLKMGGAYDSRLLFGLCLRIPCTRVTFIYSSFLIADLLVDFPADVLLARRSLLEFVLDTVGSALVVAERGQQLATLPYSADCLIDSVLPLDYSSSFSPLDAMAWLGALVKKAVGAFGVQLEGSLCSRCDALLIPPKPLPLTGLFGLLLICSVPKPYEGEEGEYSESHLSFSAQLANSMYKMRTPLLPHEADTLLAAAPHDRTGPSVTGIAFAACAAALPLLKLRCDRSQLYVAAS